MSILRYFQGLTEKLKSGKYWDDIKYLAKILNSYYFKKNSEYLTRAVARLSTVRGQRESNRKFFINL